MDLLMGIGPWYFNGPWDLGLGISHVDTSPVAHAETGTYYKCMDAKPEAWRNNFRSLVLLALLGVCAAAAWLMAWHKSSPSREGQDILATIRQKGIKSYWPQNVQRREWFLIRRGEKIVGWEMEYRQAGPDRAGGGFERQTNTAAGQERISARWKLTNNTEQGQYQSQSVKFSRMKASVTEAKIALQEGRLEVLQNNNGAHYASTTPVTENYLPEGVMSIAIHEVAKRKTQARFDMVEDESYPEESQGGQTPLYSFELRYIGQDTRTGGAMVETFFRGGGSWVTVVDDEGNVLRRFGENVEFTPATRVEVQKHFPEAAELQSNDGTVEM